MRATLTHSAFLLLALSGCTSGVVDKAKSEQADEAVDGPDGDIDTDTDDQDSGDSDDSGELPPASGLAEAITLPALQAHLDALQAIGEANGHTRQTFGPGFHDSVDYAIEVFEAAGYTVTRQDFSVAGFEEDGPPQLHQSTPTETTFASTHLATMTYSARGDVTAPLAAVDLMIPPGPSENASTSGCERSDFDAFPAGSVALIQRGSCTFADKVAHAEAAGAVAVIVFNEGQDGRVRAESWTLDPGNPPGIPVLAAAYSVGEALAVDLSSDEVQVRVVIDAGIVEQTISNVLAEDDKGDPDRLVVVGAHLDSVTAGPGINDNGSGTAFVLAAAQAAAAIELEPENRIRWALWGAEEIGLIGSDRYVSNLSREQMDQHLANLNFDMIGSPNGGRFIYDGDGSATGYPGPAGSDQIEWLFEEWFDGQGEAHAPTAFDGRSDYGPFIWNGIPAGGLFSGAEASKSMSEEDLFGGTAGQALDACYHRDCDDRDNIDETLLLEMSLAAAHVTHTVAHWTGPLGMPAPARAPHARPPEELPLSHGHDHGHGCHPVDR